MARTQILTADQIERKLQRIARQIAEEFFAAPSLHVVSIAGNGEIMGRRLVGILDSICDMPLHAATVRLNKVNPLSESVTCTVDLSSFKDQHIVLIDDVLNSGKTLIYGVNHLLNSGPKRIATAVMIDRIHRQFPIRADFCGLSLSTNLKENIVIEIHATPSDQDTADLMD
jgi:pyrimidine operon attenuation protein / uracil phosphoribosyltransferase